MVSFIIGDTYFLTSVCSSGGANGLVKASDGTGKRDGT